MRKRLCTLIAALTIGAAALTATVSSTSPADTGWGTPPTGTVTVQGDTGWG